MVKVAVLGGGINGITCAVKIKEKYRSYDVVLFANEFTPNTTGDGSGGLWHPYICGDTPEHLLKKWGIETYKLFHELWLEGKHKVSLMPLHVLFTNSDDNHSRPLWADDVFGFEDFSTEQLDYLSELYSNNYIAGHIFTTFVVSPPSILSYLYQRFSRASGKIIKAKLNSLQDPAIDGFQVVINCTGLGAKEIVPDGKMFPVRGQISRVMAPWVNRSIIDYGTGNYIIPNSDLCVLGGTSQAHDYNRKVDQKDTETIVNGCTRIIPGLKLAKLKEHWVGLRPARSEVRLEPEIRNEKLYIHNYGHGGSGLTLFWGCGTDVLQILHKNISKINTPNEISKL